MTPTDPLLAQPQTYKPGIILFSWVITHPNRFGIIYLWLSKGTPDIGNDAYPIDFIINYALIF